jgi:hypothetical protein
LEVCSILIILSLLCDYEVWTLRGIRIIKRAEMKFMRLTAGDNLLYHERNEDTLEDFKVDPVGKKLSQYK